MLSFHFYRFLLAAIATIVFVQTGSAQAPVRRIVSLAPSLTELVFTAGAGDKLVGADSISDYPAEVRNLPRVGDAFQVDYERLLALRPDAVLVWDTGTPEPVIARLQQLKLRVERVAIANLGEIAAALRHIGALAGTLPAAQAAGDTYLAQIAQLRAGRVHAVPVTVFYQISEAPLYTVNGRHLISEVIGLCGGRNIFVDLDQLAPPVSAEAVLERDPQVILTASGAQGDPLAVWKRWPRMRAMRSGNLYTVDADRLARPTTRIVEGVREVCTVLDRARERRD